MPRIISGLSLDILTALKTSPLSAEFLYAQFANEPKKKVYDTLFRLSKQGLLIDKDKHYSLTEAGHTELSTLAPERDGVWKIIIFDIPETKRPVRNFLRARLKSLGFKLWQNSIWISPYKIAPQIESEINDLAKHYFVRLIKTTDINHTTDLEKLFS